jgi:hypothetical protein
MSGDIFGNLREWREIPRQLKRLSETGSLSQHEAGLVRILRYRENWRLRELVLGVLEDLDSPSDKILFAVLDILTDETLYRDVRILAAETLGQLASERCQVPEEQGAAGVHGFVDRIEMLRQIPHEAVLASAIQQCLETMRRLCCRMLEADPK